MDGKLKATRSRTGSRLTLTIVWILALTLMGGGPVFTGKAQAAAVAPTLESYAPPTLWGGQDWNIYLKGSDSRGEMDHIWIVVSQLGGNMWYNYVLPLKGTERKAFSGYITLRTPAFFPSTGWEYVKAEIRIRDTGGHYSNERVEEVTLGSRPRGALPVEWQSASNHRMGNIFFDFDFDRHSN